MTPKEKAKELVDKYLDITLNVESDDDINKYTAKQCTLIAVDEIKEVVSLCIPYKDEKSYIDYWQKVKQELEKL